MHKVGQLISASVIDDLAVGDRRLVHQNTPLPRISPIGNETSGAMGQAF